MLPAVELAEMSAGHREGTGETSALAALHAYSLCFLTVRSADALARQSEAWKSPEKLNLVRRCTLDALHLAITLLDDHVALARRLEAEEREFYSSKLMETAAADLHRLQQDFEARWPEVTDANYEQVVAENYQRWMGGEPAFDAAAIASAMQRIRSGAALELKDIIRELQGSH